SASRATIASASDLPSSSFWRETTKARCRPSGAQAGELIEKSGWGKGALTSRVPPLFQGRSRSWTKIEERCQLPSESPAHAGEPIWGATLLPRGAATSVTHASAVKPGTKASVSLPLLRSKLLTVVWGTLGSGVVATRSALGVKAMDWGKSIG